MIRLIKFVFFTLLFAAIGLLGFAYLGPLFGIDFSAPQQAVRIPLELGSD